MSDDDVRAWVGNPWGHYDDPPAAPPEPPKPPDFRHKSRAEASRDPQVLERVGVVLGRFQPPHLGHLHLVVEAFKQCGALTVLTPFTHSDHTMAVRAAFSSWASVAGVNLSKNLVGVYALADAARVVRAEVPNVTHLFSSDPDYAARLARELKVEHVVVDAARATYPIQGRRIRADLWREFASIVPDARKHCALTVGVIGPEGTGKTTLVQELAKHFNAAVVDDVLLALARTRGGVPTLDEFLKAGLEAQRLVDEACAASESGVVIADHSALNVRAWVNRLSMLGVEDTAGIERVSKRLTGPAASQHFDVWVLTKDDLPFQGPPERDDPEGRRRFFTTVHEHLQQRKRSTLVVAEGDGAARVNPVIDAIEAARDQRRATLQRWLPLA